MSVQRALKPGGLRRRFTLIVIFLFLLHNPTPYSILELVRTDSVMPWSRISVALVALLILIVLIRQTWTGVRPLGRIAVLALLLALASFLWFLRDWITLNETTHYLAHLAVFSVVLTFGQVVSFYLRQFSGQVMVLKQPP